MASVVRIIILSMLISYSYAKFEEIRSQQEAFKYLAKHRYARPPSDVIEVSPILQPLIDDIIEEFEQTDSTNGSTPEPTTGTTPEMTTGATVMPTTGNPLQPFKQCQKDLRKMGEDFLFYFKDTKSNYYATMMVDSYGKPPPGILQGNRQWIGLYDQCVNQTKAKTQQTFGAKYGIAYALNATTKATLLSVGICVPDSCLDEHLNILLYEGISNLGLTDEFIAYVTCEKVFEYNAGAISCLVLLSIFGVLIIIGTGYEFCTIYCVSQDDPLGFKTLTEEPEMLNQENGVQIRHALAANRNVHMMSAEEESNSYVSSSSSAPLFHPSLTSVNNSINGSALPLYQPIITDDSPDTCKSFCKKIILCFSLITNGTKILKPTQGHGSLHALNGIRVISLWWVILGHTYFFPLSLFSNPLRLGSVLGRFSFQAIGNATFSVDSFFFLSGLLIAYLTLTHLKKNNGQLSWGMFYLHRYLRLTPVYMIVIFIYTTLMPHFSSGPLYSLAFDPNPVGYETGMSYCQKYWWTNLLYINNVYPNDLVQECLGWSWYLANDMQFFIITPFIIYFLYHRAVVGIGICLALLSACFASLISLTLTKDIVATPFPVDPSKENFLGNTLYTKPYTRISPYLVGMVLGYILYKCQGRVKMPRYLALIGWAVATAIGLSVIYGLYGTLHGNELNTGASVMYITFCRFAWAVALAWVSFACITGYGGPVNTLLSWSFWIPLSRINYCAYLLHPIIMMVFQYSLPTLIYFSDFLLIYFFLANLVLSYSAAFVMSICVEAPFMGLEKLILHRDKSV